MLFSTRYIIFLVIFFVIQHWTNYSFLFCTFLESNGNSKLKSVQLQKNIAQNLTCIRGSNRNRIQLWLKVRTDSFIILNLFLKSSDFSGWERIFRTSLLGQHLFNFTASRESGRKRKLRVSVEKQFCRGKLRQLHSLFTIRRNSTNRQDRRHRSFYNIHSFAFHFNCLHWRQILFWQGKRMEFHNLNCK